jgi:outer membrane immunogenic protein
MCHKLISGALGLAFSFAVSGFALAADMAVKAPMAAAPPPVYNWTGWYVGVNAGASMGNAKTDFNVAPIGPLPGFAGSATSSPSGFIGGGQIGYNWQFSPLWVGGLEADIQYAHEGDHNFASRPFSFSLPGTVAPGPSVSGTAAVDYDTKIDWFGTARARFGYLWGNGTVLTYVTGGLAYGEVKINGTAGASGTVGVTPFFAIDSFSHSHVNAGWTVGYGTEGAMAAPNWTWKVESLYMDLGHLNAADARGLITTNTHFTDWILRGGVNYRFY